MESKKRMYIVTLNWGTWQKRFYFQGDDTIQAEEEFNKACKSLNPIGDNAKDSQEFFNNAVQFFGKSGFLRIQK